MTGMPSGRPSEPRTGPAAPAPAHGDGPTGPNAPTGHTEPPRDLRERLADALRHAEHVCDEDCERRDHTYLPFDQEDPERRTTVHTTTGAILDAVLPIVGAETAALRTALKDAERERDLAIAHDRQPYPTAWAYEQACKALETHRQRAEQAERERDSLLSAMPGLDTHVVLFDPDTAPCVDWCPKCLLARVQQAERALAQARDAIAAERRGRLAAEAAARRVRELCSRGPGPANEYQIWTVDVLAALDAEQETP